MSQKFLLNQLETKRENNFNLLRFIAALMVILFHNFMFLGNNIFLYERVNIGSMAVDMFFIISGFLVSRSLLYNPSLFRYYISRFLRIWPALVLNSIVIAFIIGAILTKNLDANYLAAAVDYVYVNLTLHAPNVYTLPGVLENSLYSVVNSPLWTLGYEVFLYCVLALMSQTRLFRDKSLFLIFLSMVLFSNIVIAIVELKVHVFISNLLRFCPLFFLGVGFQLFKDEVWLSYERLLISLCLFIITVYLQNKGVDLTTLYYLLLSYIMIAIAYLPKGRLLKFNAFGDYSYGLYIYGWPVGIGLSVVITDYVPLTLLTLFLTFICAFLSWHCVEKYFLSLKHFVPEIKNYTGSTRIALTLFSLLLVTYPLINQPAWKYIWDKRVTYVHPYHIVP